MSGPFEEAVHRAVSHVRRAQDPDGAWPWEAGRPVQAAATANLLVPLTELGETEASWLERGYARLEELADDRGDIPHWALDAEEGPGTAEEWVCTLESCCALLAAHNGRRQPKRLSRKGLRRSVNAGVGAFLDRQEEFLRETGWYALQAAVMALKAAAAKSPLRPRLRKVAGSAGTDPDKICAKSMRDPVQEVAHICSAVALLPKQGRPDCRPLIEVLIRGQQQSGYWPSTVPGAGAREVFRVTCRALRALERYGKASGKARQVKWPVALGVEWLVAAQSEEEGDWKDPQGKPYPLPCTGLAALVVRRAIDQGCVPDTSKGGKVVSRPRAAAGPLSVKPAAQGAGERPRPNRKASRRRSRRTLRGSLSLDPSAYTIDCTNLDLLCKGESLSPPQVVRNFLFILAHERGGIVRRERSIAGGSVKSATAGDGMRELGQFLGPEVARALVVTLKGEGYRLSRGASGVRVTGLGEAGRVLGYEDR